MRIILVGYGGHMGREVIACAERAAGCEIALPVKEAIEKAKEYIPAMLEGEA